MKCGGESGAVDGVGWGTGGGACFDVIGAEMCDVEEALVDVEEDLEKVRLGLEEPDSLDMRDTERLRANASIEFFLVCDGDRLGIAGAVSTGAGARPVLPGAMKYEDRWFS